MRAAHRALGAGWDAVRWPTPRSATWTKKLATDSGIDVIVVIGSAARGLARSGSDVDLIVVYNDARSRVPAPAEIDARWVDLAKLRALVGKGDDVFAWGVALGLVLHDPKSIWAELVAEWAGQVPLPSPRVCAERAERARRYASELLESGDEDAAAEQALTLLTHQARGTLSERHEFPRSRPELVTQLRGIGSFELASLLARALDGTLTARDALQESARIEVERRRRAKVAPAMPRVRARSSR